MDAGRVWGQEENDREWDWMASSTQGTWVWVHSRMVKDREAWHTAVHGVSKSRTRMSNWTESRVCSNSCPLSRWCHPTISSSVFPFSSRPQSFPASGSFPMSGLFTSGGQSIGASASASVFPVDIQNWFLLGLTSLIYLLPKGLSRLFSSTTVQKHQFFSAQCSLLFNSHMRTWLLGKPQLWL